ncbi:MAG: hypothetical protein IJT32_06860, partial [Lachnospiraceae bacterium]|nr:hypothetical protein [Lachnospiraceae bacterium]
MRIMKALKPDNIHFGIGLRLSLAIGIVSIAIAGLSFGVATRLYKIITIAAVMDKNWSVIEDLMDEATEKELADILAQGKRIYESLPEDDRTDPTDPIYRSRYDALLTPGYEAVLTKLDQSVGVPRVMWADLRFKDE